MGLLFGGQLWRGGMTKHEWIRIYCFALESQLGNCVLSLKLASGTKRPEQRAVGQEGKRDDEAEEREERPARPLHAVSQLGIECLEVRQAGKKKEKKPKKTKKDKKDKKKKALADWLRPLHAALPTLLSQRRVWSSDIPRPVPTGMRLCLKMTFARPHLWKGQEEQEGQEEEGSENPPPTVQQFSAVA